MVGAYVHMCAAKKCYNSRLTHPNKGFFGFPSDALQCQKWIERCGRSDLNVVGVCKSNGYYKLCSDHFEEKCFTDSTKSCLNRIINPIPTIFFNNVEHLLPHGYHTSSTVNIDLPSLESEGGPDDPASLCEYELSPFEPLVLSDHLPISYHSKPLSKMKDYDPDTISKALLNLKPETELYYIDDVCRFCMNKALSNFIDIFSGSIEAKEIKEICEIIMQKKVDICDGMPQKVCHECIVDLKTCHKLMDKFQKANRYLRAIAKYSLFVENENNYEINESEEYTRDLSNEDFIKPVPTNAMVIPLRKFTSFIERSEDYIGEINFNTTSDNEQVISSDQDKILNKINSAMNPEILASCTEINTNNRNVETKTTACSSNSNVVVSGTSVSQLLQSMPLANPQVELINGKDLWKDNFEIMCSNVILPSKDDNSQSAVTEKPNKEIIIKDQDQVLSICAQEEFKKGHLHLLDPLNSLNKKIKFSEIITSSATLSSNLKKKIRQNDYNINKELNRNAKYLTVSCKCIKCFEIFPNYESLVEHVLNIHQKLDKSRSTICIMCSKELESPRLLKKHIKKEHQIGTFKCQKCDPGAEFNCIAELDKHLKDNHSYSCSVCNHVFYCKEKFDQHFASKHNRINCQTYGKQFKNKQSRSQEMLHKYSREICWFCGLLLKTKDALQQHLKLHDSNQSYPCKIFSKILHTPYALVRHNKLHDSGSPEKRFLCEICPKQFSTKQNLTHHLYTHSTIKQLKCDYCGKGFVQEQSLASHEKKCNNHDGICLKIKQIKGPFKLTEPPSLECDVCGRKFIKSSSVKRHRKYHFFNGNPEIIQHLLDEPEVHKCDVCGRYFFWKIAFQYHMRIHTGDPKPFKCEFCKMSYASHYQIMAHERTHTGEKPFECKYCDKGFHEKKIMLLHEMSHTNYKSHRCQICNKIYKTQRLLKAHALSHKANSCPHCGRSFINNVSLQTHVQEVHKMSNDEMAKNGGEAEIEKQDYCISEEDKNMNNLEMQVLTYIISPQEYTL